MHARWTVLLTFALAHCAAACTGDIEDASEPEEEDPLADYRIYTSPEGGFEVSMPCDPEEEQTRLEDGTARFKVSCRKGAAVLTVMWQDVDADRATRTLERSTRGIEALLDDPATDRTRTFQGYEAIDVEGHDSVESLKMRWRMFVASDRFYQVGSVSLPKDEADAWRDSFELSNPAGS